MTAFVLCALAHEMRLRRRVRALAFRELWGLALTGALSSDSLFRVSIKTNERTVAPLASEFFGCLTWSQLELES